MSRMREPRPFRAGSRSPRRRRLWPAALLPLPLLVLTLVCPAQEGKFIQHAFEGRDLLWQPGAADALYKQTDHKLTEETAHGGHRSEVIELVKNFRANPGASQRFCDQRFLALVRKKNENRSAGFLRGRG